MKNIKKILEPFDLSLGKKQDLGTLLKHLKKNNVSIEEVINYLDDFKAKEQKKIALQKIDWKKIAPRCKECNGTMRPYPVNTNPRDQVGGDHKTQWVCFACGHEEFSILSIRNWIKQMTENLCI